MRRIVRSGPSPAIVVAVLALVAAIAGTALAGSDVQSSAISKKKVKKIAKKQAKKQITKLAPSLSVAHAETAGTADSANPIAFARVRQNGTVHGGQSKNVTNANVRRQPGNLGVYCLRNLGFAFRGAQVTVDFLGAPSGSDTAQFELGRAGCGNVAGTEAVVWTQDANGGVQEDAGFFIMFYN